MAYSEEQKAEIISEYRAAVGSGGGGGQAVAKRYGVHQANIIGWEKARSKAKPLAKNGHSRRKAPRFVAAANSEADWAKASKPPAKLAPVEPVDLVVQFKASIDCLIAFHEERAAYLRKMRETTP